MLRPNRRKYLLILSAGICVFACTHIGIQAKKEGANSALIPDCQENLSKEGGLISSPIYKTWVKYDHLDLKKGFDFAIRTLQSHGH
jgi:hypothetical protein